tara:strand:+ start:2013 stop:2324 length:312 start_codon:yes stop_codon:yes gene_type:complete
MGGNTFAITQLYKKEKYMKYILPRYNLEWLEEKLTFGFSSKKSAPPPPPEKSQAEKDADANRDRNLRAEQYNERKNQQAGKRRRRGRSLLVSNDEKGLSDTLG